MARIHQAGFETDSQSNDVEWSMLGLSGAALTPLAARSGIYGLRCNGLNVFLTSGAGFQFAASAQAGPYFVRAYLKVRTPPGGTNRVMTLQQGTGGPGSTPQAFIALEANRTLTLRNQNGTQIGSATAALNPDTWYMVELKSDASPASGSRIIEGRLNGAVFATSSTQTQGNVLAYSIGANLNAEFETTGDWYWDDAALNDSTGSFQTGYPGEGKIIHIHPNAAGDANAFATQTGGTAGSTNNWTRVKDIAPDDATSFNGSATLNAEDLFRCDPPAWWGVGASDTVNVVMVGGRMRNNTADTTTAINLEIQKTSGGTIAQSSAIVLNTTTFSTNSTAQPHNYPLVLYQDPDSANWTQSTLSSMQIGYKITAAGTNRIEVTAVWASVDFTPVTVPNTIPPSSLLDMGTG